MSDYVKKIRQEEFKNVSVCFYIEQDSILEIGAEINEINESAYMNGYNWEAFFQYYLAKNYPDILIGMTSDPEAGMYVANYELKEENEKRADKFVEIIETLIENEEKLYSIIKNEGSSIEWD